MLNNQRVPTGRGEGTDLDHETPGPLKSHFPICDKTVQPFPHQILGAGSPNIVAGLSILIYIYIKHIYISLYHQCSIQKHMSNMIPPFEFV